VINLKNKIILLSLSVLFSSCIGKNFKNLISELKNETSGNLSVVAESFGKLDFFESNDGEIGHHEVFGDRPGYTVFLFSSASCLTCKKEHIEISKRLKGESPQGFELYSFMTELDFSADKDTLLKYRENWGITWPFTGDPNKFYHNKFCEGVRVPCTVIFDQKGNTIYSHTGEVHVEDLENIMKGVKVGTEPILSGDLGDNQFFGKFINETLVAGQKNESDEVIFTEMTLNENLEKPLLLILGAEDCPACEKQHENLIGIYNSSNTTLKEIDIVTVVLSDVSGPNAYDASSSEGQERLKNSWIDKFNIPWPVSGVDLTEASKYLKEYCHPADPKLVEQAPCTALYVPGKGIVLQRVAVSEFTILSTIRKHLNPVHFEESIEAIVDIPESVENAVFETVEISSELDDRPIVLIYAGNFCNACIKEHEELVELYNDPDSFVHDVRFVSLVRGYNMENEFSRNSFIQTWKIGLQVPWEMAIIKNENFDKSLDKYCKDPNKDNQGAAPCTSIFQPEYGKVYERALMHVEDIDKAVRGEEIAPHYQGDHR